jgi:OmpA-OmpF porin, OOP family
MYRKVIVAAALVLGTSVAGAQEAGWYGGLDLGRSRLSGIDVGDALDRSDNAFGFDLGYRVNRNFAVEGAFTDLGKFQFSTPGGDGELRPKAVSLSAVGILPLQANWSLYGKAGIAHTEAKVGGPFDTSDSNNGLLAGAGVMYDFNRNVYARAGWDHYAEVGTDATGDGRLNVYSIGVGYRF